MLGGGDTGAWNVGGEKEGNCFKGKDKEIILKFTKKFQISLTLSECNPKLVRPT